MKYPKVADAVFLQRPNRFLARCLLNGEEVLAHVKNTGRCRELLVPGVRVYLQDHRGEEGKRKTVFSLIAVEKNTETGSLLVNLDSQAPNPVAEEGLKSGRIRLPLEEGEKLLSIRREVTYGGSRFDLMAESSQRRWYVEVKGVTLEETAGGERLVRFPDAPTQRGLKHVEELIRAKEAGFGAALLFLIQMEGADRFSPNWGTHEAFGHALRQAEKAGVALLAYDCTVEPDSLTAAKPVPIDLGEVEE